MRLLVTTSLSILLTTVFICLMNASLFADEQPAPAPDTASAAAPEATDTGTPTADDAAAKNSEAAKPDAQEGEKGEESENEGQGAFAAPAAEPEADAQQQEPEGEEVPAAEVAPARTDFGAEDDGTQPLEKKGEVTEPKSEAATQEPPAAKVETETEENKSAEKQDATTKKKNFPKSPYPEMEGLSDQGFKLTNDEDKEEGGENQEKKVRRHTGFYLRLAPTLAYINCKGEGKSSAEKLDNPTSQGVGGLLDVFVGGAVVEDWILHADLSVAAPFAGVKGVENRKQLSLIGIGLGFTHYFTPHNLYMSANVAYAQTKMMKNGDGEVQSFDTANGFKANAAFGKEWWVADQFGLGVAGTVFYSWCTKSVLVWNIYGVGAVFTLTYN